MLKYVKSSLIAYTVSIIPIYLLPVVMTALIWLNLLSDDASLLVVGLIFGLYFFFAQPFVFAAIFLKLYDEFDLLTFSRAKLYIFSYVVFFLLNAAIVFYFIKITGARELSFVSPVDVTVFFGGRYVIFAALLYLIGI